MSYRTLLLILLTTLFTVVTKSAFSDQTDPRLDSLFARLQLTDDPQMLRATENQIWTIWMQHDNEDVERLMELGTIRMNNGQFPEALVVFNQLVDAFPDYAEGWNKRATLYYLVGNLEASLSDISQTLALEPRHFGALSGKGLVHIQRRELQQARAAFRQLLEVHPNSANAQQNLQQLEEELRLNVI